MIGLDSTAIIDFFKKDESLKNLLDTIGEPLASNQITYLEIMFGLDIKNPKHRLEESYYDEFFETLIMFDLDSRACKKSSEILWELKKAGKSIELFDCVIAGIFITNGVNKVITRNVKHFENIKNLKVIPY